LKYDCSRAYLIMHCYIIFLQGFRVICVYSVVCVEELVAMSPFKRVVKFEGVLM
jgi:hypothetical protein